MTEQEQLYHRLLSLADKIDSIADVFQEDLDQLLDKVISKRDIELELIEIKNQFELIENELSVLKEKTISTLAQYIH